MWFRPDVYIKDKILRKKAQAEFKHVFRGDEGARVLTCIGKELHAYGEILTDEDRILRNAWLRIIHHFGVYTDGNDLKITKYMIGGPPQKGEGK